MPNWVMCKLSFSGDEKDLKELKDLMSSGSDSRFDCSKLIPYPDKDHIPEDLKISELEKKRDNYYTYTNLSTGDRIATDDPNEYLDTMGFQKRYWGIKWEPSEVAWCNNTFVTFQTPWNFPHLVLEALSRKFPKVNISFEYADEDLGNNCGEGEIYGGYYLWHKSEDQIDDPDVFAAVRVWEFYEDEEEYRESFASEEEE